jgi:helicase
MHICMDNTLRLRQCSFMENTMRSNQFHSLTPPQREISDRGLLTTGFNCVLQMSTGAGKTWLAEQAIADVVSNGGRAIYLTPLRALASELSSKWQESFGAGVVGVFTGEQAQNGRYPIAFEAARVLIMTPERLDACTRNWRSHWSWIPKVDLLVVDELHLLGEPRRGPRLEGALMRIRRLNPFLRVLGLSATLGNRSELADWLDGVEYGSDWRATPLDWRTRRFGRAQEKIRLLAEEVSRCVAMGGQSLVFVHSRRRAESLSAYLKEVGIAAEHHHAGLTSEKRLSVETLYRSCKIAVLISTGTLEMGVNLPARQVVLFDLQTFDGRDFVPISVNSVWQRAGRAGRRGLDDHGEVVLIAPKWDRSHEKYEKGKFEPIRSSMGAPRALSEQILAEVASGLCKSRTQIGRVLGQSFASYQCKLGDTNKVIQEMIDAGMLVETPDENNDERYKLRATRLGHIAVRQMLLPETVLCLDRFASLEMAERLSFLDILVICIASEDCDPLIPVDFEEIEGLGDRLIEETSFLLSPDGKVSLNSLELTDRRLLNVLKTALVARYWTRWGNAEKVAEEFDCYPFEVARLAESLTRILTAFNAVLSPPIIQDEKTEPVPLEQEEPDLKERVSKCLTMVSFGLDEETVTLTYVPGIGAKWARRLAKNGIFDIEELAQRTIAELSELHGLSSERSEKWIEAASSLLKHRSAFALRESGMKTVLSSTSSWPSNVDPYRLRRSTELNVVPKIDTQFQVTGGVDPHKVIIEKGNAWCDCVDHAKGNICKHILAVKQFQGDPEVTQLVERLCTISNPNDGLDLVSLWTGPGREVRAA